MFTENYRMYLKSLKVIGFKNYAEAEIKPAKKLNCFTGLNGSGKTNLLDALYYLSFTKSFFPSSDKLNLKHGSDFFMIRGYFDLNGKEEEIYCAYKKGQKKLMKRNKKSYKKYSEHIGLLPAVMISPDDSVLISGSGQERRKYLDSVISQYDYSYLDALIKYNRILSQRNKLLKNFAKNGSFNSDTIDVYNYQLSDYGSLIFEKRREFTEKLLPVFQEYYKFVSGGKEKVGIRYKSALFEKNLETLLKENIDKDRILQHTTKGTHRDDLLFSLGDFSMKRTGSQGQQKTFLIALKLAQFEFLQSQSKKKPILLLDDIFDKFDAERVAQIIKLTENDKFGQIFITDTGTKRIKEILKHTGSEYKIFGVENASVFEINLEN